MRSYMLTALKAALLWASAGAVAAPLELHQEHELQAALSYATFDGKTETARFSSSADAPLRSYTHSSSLTLRDPGPNFVRYQESGDLPIVRSGSLAFDALFALAGAEMRQLSVAQIKDSNYNGGEPIACDCFETGAKWHYVWTRDLAYAADLGLALLDPQRVRNSLEFKLSGYRSGVVPGPQVAGSADGLQIIQDTGSGGSWPVSTDRVSWAFGAERVLGSLPAAERKAFAARALKALTNTIENDRLAAFDARSGLYNGEQSFLDWREQSYAAWIVNDLASMASAKALSTNVAHYQALTLAADLAKEHGDAARANKYLAWAGALKQAINTRLWLDGAGLYSSLTAGHFDGAPMHQFDWLGQALAVVTGVASPQQAARIVANYPHGPLGAPVIYPQLPGIAVYHNRALWPFVTAYGLKAAVVAGNAEVADAAYASLMRGAALNLSNMENLEWLSGQPLLQDQKRPELNGPVINSQRQLWSVGAYLGMVIENVFGVSSTAQGIAVQPFITAGLRRDTFGQASQIALKGLHLKGKRISVVIRLPPAAAGDGHYALDSVSVDGVSSSAQIAWGALGADSVVEVTLGALQAGSKGMRRVSGDPYAEASDVFSPRTPHIASALRGADGHATVQFGERQTGTRLNIYRDGLLLAGAVDAASWTDPQASPGACYAIEAQFGEAGNRSHHSAPHCLGERIEISVSDPRVSSNLAIKGADERIAAPHLSNWGSPGDRFALDAIDIKRDGNVQLQLQYHNNANQINLGISGGVKWMTVKDAAGRVVAQGVVQLPHATGAVYSTPLAARLKAGIYRLELNDFYNMSYLNSNSSFSAAGGAAGPSNRFDLLGVRILQVD